MTYTKTCLQCGIEFEAARKDARFHDTACRKKHQRTNESTTTNKKYTAEDYQEAYGLRPVTFLPFEPLQIPENVITLITGKEGVGKSTISLQIAKSAALAGLKVLYIDTENSLNGERLELFQVPKDNFTLTYVTYIDEVFDLVRDEATLEFDLIVLDGIERLLSVDEEQNDAYSRNIGSKAHLLNKTIRVMSMRFHKAGVTTVMINHERDVVGGPGGTYLPGGTGQKFAAAHWLKLRTTANSRFQKNGRVGGHYIRVIVAKSRYMNPHQEFKLKLTYETGELENVT